MKNSITNKRLLKLARYLGTLHLKELLTNERDIYHSSKSDCNIECFAWVIHEFPKLFAGWQYNESDVPCLTNNKHMNSLTAAGYFLELDADRLFHLFVSGYQMPDLYYGRHLREDANPGQISGNIYDYLRANDEMQEHSSFALHSVKTIIPTTLKKINHERNKNKLPKMCA